MVTRLRTHNVDRCFHVQRRANEIKENTWFQTPLWIVYAGMPKGKKQAKVTPNICIGTDQARKINTIDKIKNR